MPSNYLKSLLKPYFIKEIGNIITDYVGPLLTFSSPLEEINEAFFIDYLLKKAGEEDGKENGNAQRYVGWIEMCTRHCVYGPLVIFDSLKKEYNSKYNDKYPYHAYESFRVNYLRNLIAVKESSIFNGNCGQLLGKIEIEITNQHFTSYKKLFKSTPITFHLDSLGVCDRTLKWEELFEIINTLETKKPMQIKSIDIVYDETVGDKFTYNKFVIKVLMTEEEIISMSG
jgi:hypothetical protein